VIGDSLLKAIGREIPEGFHVIAKSQLQPADLIQQLGRGDSCVWIGDASGLPPDLWIGAFRPGQVELAIRTAAGSPLILGEVSFRKSLVSSSPSRTAVLQYRRGARGQSGADSRGTRPLRPRERVPRGTRSLLRTITGPPPILWYTMLRLPL
jgi:hypothetical protein